MNAQIKSFSSSLKLTSTKFKYLPITKWRSLMTNKYLNRCAVCSSENLIEIIDLPLLPLTGLYFPNKKLAKDSSLHDQGLNQCQDCGHAQLRNAIDPKEVYNQTYTHRSSGSSISRNGNDYLYRYINNNYKINKKTKLLELGCNDGYLLEKLSENALSSCGIDPIWLDRDPPIYEKFKIFGGFANEISKVLNPVFKPNLVVSAHTFEHTVSIFEELKCAVDYADDNADFIIEMPSFDTLIRLRRFDQVFHQHIQYISEASISKLVERLNCELIDIHYNFNYWGGTVIFAFRKSLPKISQKISPKTINKSLINESLKDFNNFKNILEKQISFHKVIYYLGAAQMLPILHYHIGKYIPKVSGILDDNESRIGKFLPSLEEIETLSFDDLGEQDLYSAGFVIGAVDSSRAIIKRTKDLGMANIYSFYQNII